MGEIVVDLTVENLVEPSRRITCRATVDVGAYGLILPKAWKPRLGGLPDLTVVDLDLMDGRVGAAEIGGPVRVQLDGFRRMTTEVVFVDMAPRSDGTYLPIVGATVLALANVEVDTQRHRLVEDVLQAEALRGVRRSSGRRGAAVARSRRRMAHSDRGTAPGGGERLSPA